MPLFEIAITTHDGEREYTAREFVVAKDLDQAVAHAKEQLAIYFGDEGGTVMEDKDNWVWDSLYEVAAEVEWVSEDNGQQYIYNIETGKTELWELVPAEEEELSEKKTWKPWMDQETDASTTSG